MSWLENLRKKPKAVRRQIMYAATLVLGVILFLFWALTLPYRFSGIEKEDVSASLKPFQILKDSVIETFEGAKESIESVNYGQQGN